MLKKAVASGMGVLLTLPLWALSTPIGIVTISSGVTVGGTMATPGTSLFSGDQLAVRRGAKATVTLVGGSRILFDAGSKARIVREGSVLALELSRGGAAFTSSSKSLVEGRLADMTFRPLNPAISSVGFISVKDLSHAILYADKGTWVVTTAHDGHSTVLKPGTHVEGTLGAAQNNQNQQKKKKKKKWTVFYIGAPLAGVATGLALAFGKSECTLQGGGNGINPSCPVSPTDPSGNPQ